MTRETVVPGRGDGGVRPASGTAPRRAARALAVLLVVLGAIGLLSQPSPATQPSGAPGRVTASPSPTAPTAVAAIPIWAYYYIWFDSSSWDRAKSDSPALGTYTSDERAVMRRHVEMARSAGIDAFLVSWKEGGKLSERLSRIAEVARTEGFHLGLVYQGLDFARRPIEVRQVCADLLSFAQEYGKDPVFRIWGDRPVVVWTGTDQFSSADQERCVAPVRDRLMVLASSRSLEEWQRASRVFEGNAYYWSSVNPEKSWYPDKLAEMGTAVHAAGGLWVAPAAPGFDARLVGGKTVVPRNDGRTLDLELDAALHSRADAIGLISWNEFTENSHVEPSTRYGMTALRALASFTGSTEPLPELDSSATTGREVPEGVNGVAALIILGALLGALLIRSRWKRASPPTTTAGGAGGAYRSPLPPVARRSG
ncbi:hypothetical protein ACK8HX_08830 [Oryzobacter sp. R7]|uniref:hypothetical protein n=1 Tax=Oryzobacter faecalis TaxID=3388656 RepID=UPI00398D58F6